MIPLHNAVQFQHLFWDDALVTASRIMDATVGNGHDLLYLASHSAKAAQLVGVDIQASAIQASAERLAKAGLADAMDAGRIRLQQGSHSDLLGTNYPFGTDAIDLVVFNLGYLPGSDHQLMTQPATTIEAVQGALQHLAPRGLITLVAYPGTPAGAVEEEALRQFLSTLPQQDYEVCCWTPLNQIHRPPVLYAIRGRG